MSQIIQQLEAKRAAARFGEAVERAAVGPGAAPQLIVDLRAQRRVGRGDLAGHSYFVVGVALWVATVESGLHPTIVGVVFGLLTPAFQARTADLDRLERILRKFRREPGPEAARTLSIAAQGAVSANDRLQYLLRP